MQTNSQQQPDNQKIESALANIHPDNHILPAPIHNEEKISRVQKNKNLLYVCEQLPHHCVQLCLLS